MKMPLHPSCRLLKADPSGLLAVDKAEGILSHPNPSPNLNPNPHPSSGPAALLDLPYDFDKEAYLGENQTWYLLNRLDGPTSGIILLAENREVAEAVKAAFAGKGVSKCYAAVVKGVPPRQRDTWRDCLEVTRIRGTLRTSVRPGRPNAESDLEVLERSAKPPARSLIALYPSTGRTHQLRVQCASRRLPVIGDATYGDFKFNREFRKRTGVGRLFLHSWKTSLSVRVGEQLLSFSAESPLPEAFAVALR